MKLRAKIYGNDGGEIFVEGDYLPLRKGFRDEYGAPLEPDEGDEIVDIIAVDEVGDEIYLTGDLLADAESELWEGLSYE